MKARFLLLLPLLALLLFSCKDAPKEEAYDIEAEKEAVFNVLESYVIANETRDMDLIKQVWADQPDIVVFGTESDERLVGWESIHEALEKQFATFKDTYVAMTETEVNVSPKCRTAWFSAMINYTFTYRGQTVSYEDLRFTGVLTKDDDDKWHIVQSHISVPAKPRNQWPVQNPDESAEDMAAETE